MQFGVMKYQIIELISNLKPIFKKESAYFSDLKSIFKEQDVLEKNNAIK